MKTEAKEGDTITKYIFKVDGCLEVSSLAVDKRSAQMEVERSWPRSTVKFLREEFSHIVKGAARHIGERVALSRPTSKAKPINFADDRTVEERMAKTLADSFSGAI